MAYFVGGDTAELTYDFYTKTANSMVNCPLEIYEGEVDPLNLPNPSGDIIYDNSNGAINFVGTWSDYSNSNDIGGSHKYTNTLGSYAELNFYGTNIQFITPKGSNFGIAKVTLDGVVITSNLDLYSVSSAYQFVAYSTTGLTNGFHTIRIEPTGNKNASSTGTYIAIDAFKVNLPWRKITDQARIDKLKEQNDIPLTGVADANFQYTLDGVTYDDNVIHIVDDFFDKTANSVVANPNKLYRSLGTSLVTPNNIGSDVYTQFKEYDSTQQSYIDGIKTLDGSASSVLSNAANQRSQQLLDWDLLEIVQRKCGPIPSDNPVQWLKDNVESIMCNAHCRGESAYGNYVELQVFSVPEQIYAPYGTVKSHVSSAITKISEGSINYKNLTYKMIDDAGKVRFIVDAKASKTTSDTFAVFSSPHNLVTGDLIHNTTRSTVAYVNGDPFYTFKTSLATVYATDTAELSATIAGQTAGDSLDTYQNVGVSFVTAEMGTNTTTIYKTNHGVPVGTYGFIYNMNRSSYGYQKVLAVNANQLSLLNSSTGMLGQTSGDRIYIYKLRESGRVLSSIVKQSKLYVDYASLEVVFKAPKNYVPSDDNIDEITFANKISGSTVANPNLNRYNMSADLILPSALVNESGQAAYDAIKFQNDGNFVQYPTTSAGVRAQRYISINVIAEIEKRHGTIPATDKVAWAKANITYLQSKIYAYATGPNGNKLYFKWYQNSISNWQTTPGTYTNSTFVMTDGHTSDPNTWMTNDGWIHMALYTDQSIVAGDANLFVDFVQFEVTLNPATSYKILTPVNNRRDAGQGQLLLADVTTKAVYKYFNEESLDAFCNIVGKSKAYLVELSLQDICNAKFGGSYVNLNAALKNIIFNLFADGYGARTSSEMEYGIFARMWYDLTKVWGASSNDYKSYTGNSIALTTITDQGTTFVDEYMTSANKIYLIIYTTNSASANIPSVLNLDFVNMVIKIARTVDIPMYYDKVTKTYLDHIPVNIGDTWGIMLKGYSPSWIKYTATKKFFALITDDNNYFVTQLSSALNKITAVVRNGTVNVLYDSTVQMPYGIKFKSSSITFILDNKNKQVRVYILYDGVFLKYVLNMTDEFKSKTSKLYILGMYTPGIQQADAYVDRPYVFNNKDFLDEEIEVMMRGRNIIAGKETDAHLNQLAEIYKNPNMLPLFNDARWTKHANAVVSADGKTLTLNATANSQASSITVPVLPNNKYRLYLKASAGKIYYTFNIGSYVVESHDLYQTNGVIELEFTTAENVNNMFISVQNGSLGAGTFIFSDMEMRRLD